MRLGGGRGERGERVRLGGGRGERVRLGGGRGEGVRLGTSQQGYVVGIGGMFTVYEHIVQVSFSG